MSIIDIVEVSVFGYIFSVMLSVPLGRMIRWTDRGSDLGILALIPGINVVAMLFGVIAFVVPKALRIVADELTKMIEGDGYE